MPGASIEVRDLVVRYGHVVAVRGVTFTAGDHANTGLPPIRISPEAGRSSPAMARSVVVLPHPEGPSSVRCSPAPTVKVIPRTATTLP